MNWLKKIKFFVKFLIVLIAAIAITCCLIYRPHLGTAEQSVIFNGTANEFRNLSLGDSMHWTGKVVQLKGRIGNVEEESFTMNTCIYCQFENPNQQEIYQDSVLIKGRFIGYDDLLGEIKLDKCIIISQQ